jgi:hypothetical protein
VCKRRRILGAHSSMSGTCARTWRLPSPPLNSEGRHDGSSQAQGALLSSQLSPTPIPNREGPSGIFCHITCEVSPCTSMRRTATMIGPYPHELRLWTLESGHGRPAGRPIERCRRVYVRASEFCSERRTVRLPCRDRSACALMICLWKI